MAPATSKADDNLRHGLWVCTGLALLSLLCAYVLLPLAALGSHIAAGVVSQARPLFEGVAALSVLVAIVLVLRIRRLRAAARSAPPPPDSLSLAPRAGADLSEYPVLTSAMHTSGFHGAGPETWSAAVLRRMDWYRFAELCVAYYRETGKYCSVTKLTESKGIDIRLFEKPGGAAQSIIRCWGWGVHRVPSSHLMELREVMLREKIPQGAWLTNARFGDEIVRFGEAHRIAALDIRRFLAMLQNLPAESSLHLFQMATEGDWKTPTCPLCEGRMVRRKGVDTDYWACLRFPACDSMLKIRSGK